MTKNILLQLVIVTFLVTGIQLRTYAQDHHGEEQTNTVVSETSHNGDQAANIAEENHGAAEGEHNEGGEGEHEGGMEPLFFVIIAIFIGAATRHFFRKIPLPFTVLLLIFGIGLGLMNRFDLFHGWGESFSEALIWAGHINPHAILFIFLPILIFEAAFGMDIHTFKKTATNSIILAVPGIIVALLLSAGLAMLMKFMNIGLYSWEWSIALMFGSVISATDPVAVVALLKELGASKKLGTLIEGESVLNDGTAIVIFMVFFTAITGVTADNNAVVEFARVAFGGILIGIVIAAVCIAWVKRVFNDALVEISVIIGAAYITFYIAEDFMHMSGVLGLCTLGLAMAGVGKTRISPEVGHFLHEFWELAAFIANTLIFIIVGVVISQRTNFTAYDFIILGIVYVGLHIIRAIMILMFYPIMKRIGYGLNPKEGVVLWYGALRGAIGLALALVVEGVDDKYLAPEIKNQFFFLTAGIVTLTLLVNATTIKLIVNKLGLTKIAPAKALMILSANDYLRSSAENALERIKTDRFMGNANWGLVKEYMPKKVHMEQEFENIKIDTISEMRKRILEKEKGSYWHQFKDGMLGSVAVRRLSDQIDEMMDGGGLVSLAERNDLELMMKTPKILSRMQTIPVLKTMTRQRFFERLSNSYEIARGFVEAQEEAIKLVESIGRSLDPSDKSGTGNLSVIESEINENKIEGLTFIRNLRKTYPEIYDAISTRHAIRTLLNYELKTVDRLHKNGRIDSGEADKMIHGIEERMKRLMQRPPKVQLPDPSALIQEIPWLKNLEHNTLVKLGALFQTRVFAIGEKMIREGNTDEGIFVIARGTAKISLHKNLIDIVGSGTILGEITTMTGKPRTATVEAESPVTALYMPGHTVKQIAADEKDFDTLMWKFTAIRLVSNQLKNQEPFSIWRPKDFQRWLQKAKVEKTETDMSVDMQGKVVMLIKGKASTAGSFDIHGPLMLEGDHANIAAGAVVFIGEIEKEE